MPTGNTLNDQNVTIYNCIYCTCVTLIYICWEISTCSQIWTGFLGSSGQHWYFYLHLVWYFAFLHNIANVPILNEILDWKYGEPWIEKFSTHQYTNCIISTPMNQTNKTTVCLLLYFCMDFIKYIHNQMYTASQGFHHSLDLDPFHITDAQIYLFVTLSI